MLWALWQNLWLRFHNSLPVSLVYLWEIWIMVMTILIIQIFLLISKCFYPAKGDTIEKGWTFYVKTSHVFLQQRFHHFSHPLCVEIIRKGSDPFDSCWQPEMNCWWCLRLFLEVLNTRVMCFLQALSLRHIARWWYAHTKGRSAAGVTGSYSIRLRKRLPGVEIEWVRWKAPFIAGGKFVQ